MAEPTFPKIEPLYGPKYDNKLRQAEKALPPAPGTPRAPPTAADPIAGMPRLPSPFDIPEVADFAEGFFGRSPLGAIRNFVSEQLGGKIQTQQEKTAAAEQRSPVATGLGRVGSDVTTAASLAPKLGLLGAGAAPEMIDAVTNKKLLNTDQGPIDWGEVAKTGMRAGVQGLGAKTLGDPSALIRSGLRASPISRVLGLHNLVPSMPGLAPGVSSAPVAGLFEWLESMGTDREKAARDAQKKRAR